jgi:pyroglutamyl-peptidase
MGAAVRKNLPRVLLTGFEAFPGAPVNPTEALVRRLQASPPRLARVAAFRAELLPVDYVAIGSRLSDIGSAFRPDIAIHLGLAGGCKGFRLERLAHNRFSQAKPDNRGYAPPDGAICSGPPRLPSTLPMEAIHNALADAGLPVEWSDDAGGYLCNTVFMLSAAAACGGFAPRLTGFIHVSMIGKGQALTEPMLQRGVRIIVKTTLAQWAELL